MLLTKRGQQRTNMAVAFTLNIDQEKSKAVEFDQKVNFKNVKLI